MGALVTGKTSTAAATGATRAYEAATGHATFTHNPRGGSPVTFIVRQYAASALYCCDTGNDRQRAPSRCRDPPRDHGRADGAELA